MMRIPTGELVQHAEDIPNFTEARKLRDGLLSELHSTAVTPVRAYALEQALDALDYNYPKLQESKVALARERQAKRESRAKPKGEAPARSKTQGKAPAGRGRASRIPTSRGSGRSAVGRRFAQTGIPGAYQGATQTLMQLLGLTIGLSLLYLLLTNTERARRGSSAIEQISAAFANGAHRLIAPVDPLAGGHFVTTPTTGARAHRGPVAVTP